MARRNRWKLPLRRLAVERDLQLPFRLANELCRIPFEFVDPAMHPARQARRNDNQLFYLVAGKILSFGLSGPRIFFGAGRKCGGGILRFNFSKLPTTAGAYR